MTLGDNIQYLRKINGITQLELAEKLSVSRQTISRWEMNQVYPEIPKLIEIGNIFHCKVDELLKENMPEKEESYSKIEIKEVEGFRMGLYVMISANPEDDVNSYMKQWADKSGLYDISGYKAKLIGWDFPFVSMEQQSRFGLRGYAAAYVIPDDFEPKCGGVEITRQDTAMYATITIRNPFSREFELIPEAYKKIMRYLNADEFKKNIDENYLPCFEYIYEKNGVTYMEVYIHVDSVKKA